jgi:5,6-dimethylbenzimidazole synthase
MNINKRKKILKKFSKSARTSLQWIIQSRRDIRHFLSKPIPNRILIHILKMGHAAPSVGFMQPWNFILIRSARTRKKIKDQFEKINQTELTRISEQDRKTIYSKLKLEGILETPLNIAVTCDHRRDRPFILGNAPMPETDLYSTCLAIQNMWLVARAEGIGIGWVSIINRKVTEEILKLPDGVQLVAYLCLGYPKEFREKPLLEEVGWKQRMNLKSLVFDEQWNRKTSLEI